MLLEVKGFIIANWFMCVCVIAMACNWRIGEHRFLSFIIALFAVFNYLIIEVVRQTGSWWYIIWAAIEVIMFASLLGGFKLLRFRVNLHLVTASLASLLFVLTNVVRYVDRYHGLNMLQPYYKPLVLVSYLMYCWVMVSPIVGVLLLKLVSLLKGFLNAHTSYIISYFAYLCIFGHTRIPLLRA